MQEYLRMKKTLYRRICLFYLILLPGLVIQFKPAVLAGLTLGTLVSLYNLRTLTQRIEEVEKYTPERAVRHMRMGATMRLLLVFIALLFAVKHPLFDFTATAVGVMLLQVAIYAEVALAFIKRGYQKLQTSYAVKQGGGE